MSTSDYKVGALSALLSGETSAKDNEDAKSSSKTKKAVGDLFTTDKKQKAAVQTAVDTKKIAKKRRRARKSADKDGLEVKKAKRDNEGSSEDEDEEPPTYAGPSFKQQVRNEDAKERVVDPEKDARTVFVGNLPVAAKEKGVRKMFMQYGAVETVRFRGVARPDMKTTKKLAVIKRQSHENRSNINAYVRFATVAEAKKACAANGKSFQENVLRVDIAASAGSKHDTSKGVFLGNLPLAVEENAVHAHFIQCGAISDVRIVRDAGTGIGKGFGYVNFKDMDSVSNALQLNGTKLEGRAVRVDRCVRKAKPRVERPNASSGNNAKKPALKKVTRKKLSDMKKTEFQGHAVGEDKKKKGKKGFKNKGEAKKKALSKKLLH